MTEAKIVDPVILVRIPRAFRLGISDLALYEATRGVWRVGLRREHARYALAIHEGVVLEVYEILHWIRLGRARIGRGRSRTRGFLADGNSSAESRLLRSAIVTCRSPSERISREAVRIPFRM